jgi:hypothetical protein
MTRRPISSQARTRKGAIIAGKKGILIERLFQYATSKEVVKIQSIMTAVISKRFGIYPFLPKTVSIFKIEF